MAKPLAVIVLAAGFGTRTKVGFPKVLLPLCGRTVLSTVLDTVATLLPERTVVLVHHGKEQVEKDLLDREGCISLDQGEPKGTGHAVQVAMTALEDFEGDVLVVYGDVPLISADTLRLLRTYRGSGAASILTAFASPPEGMGRILRDGEGQLTGIREQQDCSPEELEIEEFNAGFYCLDSTRLPGALASLQAHNAQGELYLTDTIAWLLAQDHAVNIVSLESPEEVSGVNTLEDLAFVRQVMQERILLEHLENGVIIEDPATTYIDHGVSIGADTTILPCTVIRSGVTIGEGCEIGPFSHLRVGTYIDDRGEIGNFVECKKTFVGKGTKAKHLTYLGDATIGEGANIGAGTITANYDGINKHPTLIADGAFVGSGTVLVAPSKMGIKAMTGAGAIVTRNTSIPDGDVFVGVPARSIKDKDKDKDKDKASREEALGDTALGDTALGEKSLVDRVRETEQRAEPPGGLES